jgi:hypothetical protein
MNLRAILIPICWFGLMHAVSAAPSTFDTQNDLPPVVEDTTKAATCTVTYLVDDITTNDTIAVRMRIAPDPDDKPANNLMPCPPDIPPRVAARALDACITRAADPRDCVFADMGRDFAQRPDVDASAENSSRCASDKAADIGIACWRSGELQICGVGCGASPNAAVSAAVNRCETKHQRQCPITGSLPVLAPR